MQPFCFFTAFFYIKKEKGNPKQNQTLPIPLLIYRHEQLQGKINTYNCDLAYEKALSATAQILCDEKNRRLRVELLHMETEKSELNHRVNLGARQIEICRNANLKQQSQLTVAVRDLEKANLDLRACSRKNDALNVRIFQSST